MRFIKAWFFAAIAGGGVHLIIILVFYLPAPFLEIICSLPFGLFFSVALVLIILIPAVIAGSVLLSIFQSINWFGFVICQAITVFCAYWLASEESKLFGSSEGIWQFVAAGVVACGVFWQFALPKTAAK